MLNTQIMNKCAHPKCDIQKLRGEYACRVHWFSLPKGLRSRIYSSYNKDEGAKWLEAHKEATVYWEKK